MQYVILDYIVSEITVSTESLEMPVVTQWERRLRNEGRKPLHSHTLFRVCIKHCSLIIRQVKWRFLSKLPQILRKHSILNWSFCVEV